MEHRWEVGLYWSSSCSAGWFLGIYWSSWIWWNLATFGSSLRILCRSATRGLQADSQCEWSPEWISITHVVVSFYRVKRCKKPQAVIVFPCQCVSHFWDTVTGCCFGCFGFGVGSSRPRPNFQGHFPAGALESRRFGLQQADVCAGDPCCPPADPRLFRLRQAPEQRSQCVYVFHQQSICQKAKRCNYQ